MSDLVICEMEEGFPNPQDLQKAVVFVQAKWSVFSKFSWESLLCAANEGLDDGWKIFVLDTDRLNFEDFCSVYGPFPSTGGWGEAFWIQNGKVIFADRGYHNGPLRRLLSQRVKAFVGCDVTPYPLEVDDAFLEAVKKQCQHLPSERLQIYDLECPEIQDLESAVLTMHHVNKAGAVVTTRLIAKQLARMKESKIKLIVLNEAAVSFSDTLRILGEPPRPARTYWISDGKIVFRSDGYQKENTWLLNLHIWIVSHFGWHHKT